MLGEFDARPGLDAAVNFERHLAPATLFPNASVLLLSGDGRGAFGDATALAAGGAVVSGDFNRDGIADFAGPVTSDVRARLGTGGGYTPAIPSGSSTGGTVAVFMGDPVVWDVDHDGRPDLIVVDRYGTITTAFGNGDGTFATVRPNGCPSPWPT